MLITFLAESVLAVSLFASTNVDDLILLSLFFALPGRKAGAIVVGQFIGIAGLTVGSIVIARLALQTNQAWVPYLGLVPIYLGLRQLFSSSKDEVPVVQPSWLSVAVVTFANGADNLGAYVPVFATRTVAQTFHLGLLFFLLTGIWCWLAYRAVDHPKFGLGLRKLLTKTSPWALLLIGLWILRGAF